MYNVEDFMKMSERPSVIIYSMYGNSYTMNMRKVERPLASLVRNVCRNGTNGIVEFKDEFTITMLHTDDIFKAALYYDDVLVSIKMFPPIFMCRGDSITLKFNLTMFRKDNEVFV